MVRTKQVNSYAFLIRIISYLSCGCDCETKILWKNKSMREKKMCKYDAGKKKKKRNMPNRRALMLFDKHCKNNRFLIFSIQMHKSVHHKIGILQTRFSNKIYRISNLFSLNVFFQATIINIIEITHTPSLHMANKNDQITYNIIPEYWFRTHLIAQFSFYGILAKFKIVFLI